MATCNLQRCNRKTHFTQISNLRRLHRRFIVASSSDASSGEVEMDQRRNLLRSDTPSGCICRHCRGCQPSASIRLYSGTLRLRPVAWRLAKTLLRHRVLRLRLYREAVTQHSPGSRRSRAPWVAAIAKGYAEGVIQDQRKARGVAHSVKVKHPRRRR